MLIKTTDNVALWHVQQVILQQGRLALLMIGFVPRLYMLNEEIAIANQSLQDWDYLGVIYLDQWFSTFFSLRHLFTLNYFLQHTQFLKHTKLIAYIMFAREQNPNIHSYDTKFSVKRCFQMFLIYKIQDFFLATHWRFLATHKCVATPSLRNTDLDKIKYPPL